MLDESTSHELSWTVQRSSDGLNITSQLWSIVHLFSVLLWMTEDPHTAPLIEHWTLSHRGDLMVPVSFSSEKPQRWQSDRIIWNWDWQMCFQPSTGALLIYVTEEWESSCSFRVFQHLLLYIFLPLYMVFDQLFFSSSLFCELIGTLAWSLHVLWPISDSISSSSFDSEPSESDTPGAETFFPTPAVIVRNLISLVLVQVYFVCFSNKHFFQQKKLQS